MGRSRSPLALQRSAWLEFEKVTGPRTRSGGRMAFTIRLVTKQRKKAFAAYLSRAEHQGGVMIKDADKIQTPTLRSIPMAFLCPPGFEPAAFLITAINQSGQSYTNAPIEQPHLTLHLATLALNFASQLAVKCMQTARQ